MPSWSPQTFDSRGSRKGKLLGKNRLLTPALVECARKKHRQALHCDILSYQSMEVPAAGLTNCPEQVLTFASRDGTSMDLRNLTAEGVVRITVQGLVRWSLRELGNSCLRGTLSHGGEQGKQIGNSIAEVKTSNLGKERILEIVSQQRLKIGIYHMQGNSGFSFGCGGLNRGNRVVKPTAD